MSLSKYKSSNFKAGTQSRDDNSANGNNTLIYEHIRRIDGSEQIKKYLKCGLLGKGGFANCFITENMDTRTKAATKVVVKDELRTHRTRLRLANEIKLHKTLHHPNVVQLYHCFEDKENVYIFLELCQNQSLNELLRIRGNFLTPEIQSFLYGIVNGLSYIHKQKIIHRDLKLGNIFVDGKLNIKIGDFGLATKLEFRRECKRTVCGTPNYIAPEVLDGRGYHFEVDVWSVGVILYTLYFGIPPFQTEDANSTYQKIKECDYLIPKTVNTPPEAISLIQKILVRNPAQRLTLDQILESDFMRLGHGVLKELPLVCSKKAPTKKELNSSLPLVTGQTAKVSQTQKVSLNKEYLTSFEEVLEGTFYFKFANGQSGIIETDVRIVYQHSNGKYFVRSLTNDYEAEAGEDCDLKYLLMVRDKKYNVLDELGTRPAQEKTLLVRRVKRITQNDNMEYTRGWLLRLSNNSLQLLLEDKSYLIVQNHLFELTPQKEKEISLSKLKTGTLKGKAQDLKLLWSIVTELEKKLVSQSLSSDKSEKEIEKMEGHCHELVSRKQNCKTEIY